MNETHLSVKDKSILEKIFFAHQVYLFVTIICLTTFIVHSAAHGTME